jgi:hypothetical protein
MEHEFPLPSRRLPATIITHGCLQVKPLFSMGLGAVSTARQPQLLRTKTRISHCSEEPGLDKDELVRELVGEHLLEPADLRVPVQVEVVRAPLVPPARDPLRELRGAVPDVVVILDVGLARSGHSGERPPGCIGSLSASDQ